MTAVLIVDDDPILRAVAAEALRGQYQLFEASDGAEALEVLQRVDIDLVFLDMLMPVKDGYEVLLEIRRRFPTVQVAAMSGGGRVGAQDLLATATVFGARAALRKPLRPTDFVSTARALLN